MRLALLIPLLFLPGCAAMGTMDPNTAYQMGALVGCALGGGCNTQAPPPQAHWVPTQPVVSAPAYTQQSALTKPQPTSYTPPAPATYRTPAASTYTPPVVTAAQIAAAPNCTMSHHCGVGQVCVPTTYGKGYCAIAVNRYGIPIHTRKPGLVSCRWSTDCATGFTCEKQPAQLDGYCVQ